MEVRIPGSNYKFPKFSTCEYEQTIRDKDVFV